MQRSTMADFIITQALGKGSYGSVYKVRETAGRTLGAPRGPCAPRARARALCRGPLGHPASAAQAVGGG
jgi:hypothetical protein